MLRRLASLMTTAYEPAVTLPFHATSCLRRSVVHVDAMFRWCRSEGVVATNGGDHDSPQLGNE